MQGESGTTEPIYPMTVESRVLPRGESFEQKPSPRPLEQSRALGERAALDARHDATAGVSVAEASKHAATLQGYQVATPLTGAEASKPKALEADMASGGGGRAADPGDLREEMRPGGGVYVSIVLAARNDGHEGNFILRFNKSIHYICIFVDRIVLLST